MTKEIERMPVGTTVNHLFMRVNDVIEAVNELRRRERKNRMTDNGPRKDFEDKMNEMESMFLSCMNTEKDLRDEIERLGEVVAELNENNRCSDIRESKLKEEMHKKSLGDCRPEVIAFAKRMERALSDDAGESGWKIMTDSYLYYEILSKAAGIGSAMIDGGSDSVFMNAVSVANLAMMIADNTGKL